MSFYRIFPSADTWITDRIISNDVSVTATGSNLGASPDLSVFAFEPTIQSGTVDLARALLQFNITELSGKIYDEGIIPSSSVSYYLKMFDMKHEDTVPTSYDLFVYPLSRSWDEGNGVDQINFRDYGYCNWIDATSTNSWITTGSDFLTTGYGSASQHFDRGGEDLEVDVTDIVINWLTGSLAQNGIIVKLGDSEEGGGVDYFRKVFHSRESKYIDRLPYIEARWSNVVNDHRDNFAFANSSKLYLYNFVRGELVNLTEPVITRAQDSINSASYSVEVTASRVETGIYEAEFNIPRGSYLSATWCDVWYSGSVSYMTGAFKPLILTGSQVDPYDEFVIDVVNLKGVYNVEEEARLIVNVRKRDYVTHVGPLSSGSLQMEKEYIEKIYYSIVNDETSEIVVPFGTGSVPYTQLSYNNDGNYFNLWMNNFVPGFKYRMKFLIDINRYDKKVIDDNFTFKVV